MKRGYVHQCSARHTTPSSNIRHAQLLFVFTVVSIGYTLRLFNFLPDRFGISPTSFFFVLKAPRSTGESCKILDAHDDRTQRRRSCPRSLGTRNTEVYAHHTHQHTRTRPQHPGAGRGFEPPLAASHPRELPTERRATNLIYFLHLQLRHLTN